MANIFKRYVNHAEKAIIFKNRVDNSLFEYYFYFMFEIYKTVVQFLQVSYVLKTKKIQYIFLIISLSKKKINELSIISYYATAYR